jgi:hypothetical protein
MRKEKISSIVCQFCGEQMPIAIEVDMDDIDPLLEKLKYAHRCPWSLDDLSLQPRLVAIKRMLDDFEETDGLANYLLRLERRVEALEKAVSANVAKTTT